MKYAKMVTFPIMIIIAIIAYITLVNSVKSKSVVIGFGGDVMLGRLVNETINNTSYAYPWGNILPLLHANDINIINLETTLTRSESVVPKVFNFKATPDKMQTLVNAQITICNLANNHIGDFGIEGLQETITVLDQADIAHVGAGMNISQAAQPIIIERNGIKIGIIGYTDNEPDWLATDRRAGTNYIQVGDIKTVQKQIDAFKDIVDIVIATIHWGPNMREQPTQQFIDFAHAMIDAGVNIIHGHSAHIFQGIEFYNSGLIMYDTGDLVDDYAVDEKLRNNHSFLFLVTVTQDGIKNMQLIPTLISNMQVNKATGDHYVWSIERMQQLSTPFGTQITDDGKVSIP